MHVYEVIKRPIDTEKTRYQTEDGKYTFEVDRRANKHRIKEAVEEIFDVEVLSVNTIIMPAKRGRYGRRIVIRKPVWKKAIVTLAPGERIDIFEGV
jgi:large subunit ribosomal protein L23